MIHEKIITDKETIDGADVDILPSGLMLKGVAETHRDTICKIYKEAVRLSKSDEPGSVADAVFSCLDAIPGIDIIEPRSFTDDFGYRCAEYVFGEVYGEDWAQQFITDNEPQFWSSTVPFLTQHGYIPIEQPRHGDVVAYGGVYEDGRVWFGHFGVYAGSNKVVSKYGRGPIAIHDLPLISKGGDRYDGHWGDHVWFFAKKTVNLAEL